MAKKQSEAKKGTRTTGKRKTAVAKDHEVSFAYSAPEAERVAVAGEFNQWHPDVAPMRKDLDGVWRVTLRLAPGTYEYKFVVNGESWVDDPVNPRRVPNAQGSMNSVVEVPRPA